MNDLLRQIEDRKNATANQLPDGAVIAYTDLFKLSEHEIEESDTNIHFDPAESNYYEFLTKDMHFIRILRFSGQDQKIPFKSEKPYISLVFSFKSKAQYFNKKNNKVFADIQDSQCGILFINDQLLENHWISQPGGEMFVINVTIEYFKRFLPVGHPLYETFFDSIKENLPVLLNEKVITITPRMKVLLYDLFQNEQKNHYKSLYLKSRFLELLMLQFQEYEMLYKAMPEIFTSDSNLEKMYDVRDIIDMDISRSCTLLDLAQQVGTNECYLKKHFKQVFGTTVFGYVHTQRMNRSKELLMNEDMKIAEVAKLSGYKHASHFTTAFKKYFGYLPHQIKILLVTLLHQSEMIFPAETFFMLPV